MEPNSTQEYGAGKEVPAQVVPFTAEDRAFFESKKFSLSTWMTVLIFCAIVWLAYEIFTSGASIWVDIGFCIFVGLCVYMFRYFFVTKTNRILAHGMKHTGQARVTEKIGYQDHNGSASIFSLKLDWESSKEIREVHVSKDLYLQVKENDLVYVEASPLSKRPIKIKKVMPTGGNGF